MYLMLHGETQSPVGISRRRLKDMSTLILKKYDRNVSNDFICQGK